MISWNNEVLQEMAFGGMSARLVDYRWNERADILQREADFTLRWRLQPDRVRMTGSIFGPIGSFGRLMLHRPDEPYRSLGGELPGRAVTVECHLEEDFIASLVGDEMVGEFLHSSLNFQNENIAYLMRRVGRELSKPGLQSELLVRSWLTSMSVELARHCRNAEALTGEGHSKPTSLDFGEIVDMIRTSDQILRASAVAKRCGLSDVHFRRLFKSATGRSISDVIAEERASRARNLLRNTDIRIKAISRQLGYNGTSAFSYAFKQATGRSPLQFRNEFRDARRH